MTTQSDEYRCEAYAILYSFHQSDNPIEAFAQGYEAGAKSREQVSEQQIETVSRILYKCSFGFPFDEDSIDGMFDHAVDGKLSTGNTCGMRPASTEAKASSNRNAPPPNGSLEE